MYVTIPKLIMSLFIYRKFAILTFILCYFVYMMAEMGYLYLDYLNYAEILGKDHLEVMSKHLIKLQEMYTILPEHAQPLRPESVTTIYESYGISNYHEFLYNPERMSSLHEIMQQNSQFASRLSNVVRQDILNVHQAQDRALFNDFIQQGKNIAATYLVGCLVLITMYAIHNASSLVQGIAS